MQVQQDDDRLRTALLKHWLDMSSNSALVDAVLIHFHITKGVWLLVTHNPRHTYPSAALASVSSERPHPLPDEPNTWRLEPWTRSNSTA
jgi:hypothetical protein